MTDNFMHSASQDLAPEALGTGWSGQLACCGRHDVYSMRMARVNITVPDEVIVRAREARLNISRIATGALAEELNRLVKRAELDAYLAALEAERGPITEEAAAEGRAWLDAALAAPPVSDRHPGAA